MKNFLFALFSLCLLNILQGQSFGIAKGQPESPETPTVLIKQFKKDYPAFTPTWSREGYNYRADYTNTANNTAGMVVYDKNGRILRSETEMQANSYPGSINDYHTSNLPSSKYRVYATKDTTGVTSFYSTSDGQTYYFDKDGHFRGRNHPAAPAATNTLSK